MDSAQVDLTFGTLRYDTLLYYGIVWKTQTCVVNSFSRVVSKRFKSFYMYSNFFLVHFTCFFQLEQLREPDVEEIAISKLPFSIKKVSRELQN